MKEAGGSIPGAGGRGGLRLGPRMPSALQAVGWARGPYPFMKRCQERFGDIFTLRILHSGTWVFLCAAEDVKGLCTSPAGSLGVALANPLLLPVLGPRSVMLLEEPGHMTRRRLMLPPFHGQRMGSDAEMMARVTLEAVRGWPLGEPFELWPHMQAITQEGIMRSGFGPYGGGGLDHLRELLHQRTAGLNDPGPVRPAAARRA